RRQRRTPSAVPVSADVSKGDCAEALVAEDGVISVQVLNEFSSVARRKLGMSWAEIREVLTTIRVLCRVETLGLETHETGLALAERHGFAIYNAMILASAQLAGCHVVYTEDLQHGQVIDDRLETIIPFPRRGG
ncbi:MAG: PIN domain-containing protein, partial [Gammaproteobacteria bacterium]|nr:PIN domain-containing protein [Gammaproteobacteria bacterium]